MPIDFERPMAVSYSVVGGVVVFGGGGYMLDRVLSTSPWLLLTGLAVSVMTAFYALGKLLHTP